MSLYWVRWSYNFGKYDIYRGDYDSVRKQIADEQKSGSGDKISSVYGPFTKSQAMDYIMAQSRPVNEWHLKRDVKAAREDVARIRSNLVGNYDESMLEQYTSALINLDIAQHRLEAFKLSERLNRIESELEVLRERKA